MEEGQGFSIYLLGYSHLNIYPNPHLVIKNLQIKKPSVVDSLENV